LIYGTNAVLFDENNLWALTEDGLYRFGVNDLQTPLKIYHKADGLKGDSLFCGFKDSKGNLWFSTRKNAEVDGLSVFDHATQKFHAFSTAENFPNNKSPASFAEDRSGNLWFGFYDGGLVKYANGRFTDFSGAKNFPSGGIFGLLVDTKNRLWLASSGGGVAVVEDLQSNDLKFRRITTEQGLATDNARCLTEDSAGNIYTGTVRGIDRITPETGQIRHFSTSDGLSGDFVNAAFRDKNGTLWFGTTNGLSKFEPQSDFVQTAPEIFISNLQIAGLRYSVSGFGQKEIGEISVGASENNLEINFSSVAAGENPRFQYKLEDADGSEQNWSAPAEQNSLNLARLASGTYKFSVRAVNSAGVTSEIPAVISFKIAPPFWQSWWFRLLAALFVIGLILLVERTRAARLRELKKAFGKLSVSENRFRQMNEQSPLGIIVFAPDGSIRAVNQAYEDFWGITFEQIKNWDFFNDEQLIRIGVIEKMRRVFAGETVHFPPEPYNPRDNNHGVEFVEKSVQPWFESFAYPVKTEAGELLEVILVMEDVTDTKRADEIERTAKSERLRELEQVRRRIAADLHDDIGSSLTQISIYSEVLQQRVDKSNEKVLEPLEFIANSSRELIDSMSDIVWAINPQKDFLSELSGKMHRFAADVLTAKNIEFTYTASPIADIALGANLRREVFLIFKESVNNIVKHADCKKVKIELIIENAEIILRLQDDGKGFAKTEPNDGHGLVSMHARATGLGGKLEIVSGKISGTIVKLNVPLQLEQ
jgi:PAS domain S-box-containing protein